MRLDIAVATALAASLFVTAASANSGGVAGYTGKPNASAPQGESCNQCHGGGTAPDVSITGPASLAAGASAEFTLVVRTSQSRAAGGVAATDGVVLTPGSGLRDSFGEMVQSATAAVSGGQATFKFTVKAPQTGSTLKLWAVGLAANGNGATSGDRAAHATKDVAVTGGTSPPPPPPPPPSSDAGSGSSSGDPPGPGTGSGDVVDAEDPGASSGGSSTGSTDREDADEPSGSEADPSGSGAASRRRSGADAAACAAEPRGGSSSWAVPGVVWIVGLAACARRRRRQGGRS